LSNDEVQGLILTVNKNIEINWDLGTAYDLFFSLWVLHRPDEFGLRRSWAAGVRSRLPEAERRTLEEFVEVVRIPLSWIEALPEPKDGAAVIAKLKATPPSDRLPALVLSRDLPEEASRLLQQVADRGSWDEKDYRYLQTLVQERKGQPRDLRCALEWWSQPVESGERLLSALEAYYGVFFTEEERRIYPVLHSQLKVAQQRADEVDWITLLEELSQGVSFQSLDDISELVLAPSFWSTPFIVYQRLAPRKPLAGLDAAGLDRLIVMYGARPDDVSLAAGAFVPDPLLLELKALADPTRLRILHFLARGSLTPSQLARRLRLRAPTVIHHLNALRLAGLVRLTVDDDGEKRYAARLETVEKTFEHLQQFLDVKIGAEN
jgi:DNA-binding transcriptional ArsR family regulator